MESVFKSMFSDGDYIDGLTSIIEIDFIARLIFFTVLKFFKAVFFKVLYRKIHGFSFGFTFTQEFLVSVAIFISLFDFLFGQLFICVGLFHEELFFKFFAF